MAPLEDCFGPLVENHWWWILLFLSHLLPWCSRPVASSAWWNVTMEGWVLNSLITKHLPAHYLLLNLSVFCRSWSWSNYSDWRADCHHCGCKGRWERQGDMHGVHSRWRRGGCGCSWKWGWNVWHLLHSTPAWEIRHLCALRWRAHPQQPLPSHGT